jgi:hypothetical protein
MFRYYLIESIKQFELKLLIFKPFLPTTKFTNDIVLGDTSITSIQPEPQKMAANL